MDPKSTSEIQLIADRAASTVCDRQSELCTARMALVQQQVDNIEGKVEKQTKAISNLAEQVTMLKTDMTEQVSSLKADMAKQNSMLVLEVAALKQKWTIWPTLGAIAGTLGAIAGLVTFVIAMLDH